MAARFKPPFLPSVTQFKKELHSSTARAVFATRKRDSLLKSTIRKFNQNPSSFFQSWKRDLRKYILFVEKVKRKKTLTREEIIKFADLFAKVYTYNGLTEAVRDLTPVESGFYPSPDIGIFQENTGKGRNYDKNVHLKYQKPLAVLLINNVKTQAGFDSAMGDILHGRTTAHGRVRTLRLMQTGEKYYYRLRAMQQEYYARLKKARGEERKGLRQHEEYTRQFTVINTAHSAISIEYAPLITHVCDSYIRAHGIKGIRSDVWAPIKLAQLAGKI